MSQSTLTNLLLVDFATSTKHINWKMMHPLDTRIHFERMISQPASQPASLAGCNCRERGDICLSTVNKNEFQSNGVTFRVWIRTSASLKLKTLVKNKGGCMIRSIDCSFHQNIHDQEVIFFRDSYSLTSRKRPPKMQSSLGGRWYDGPQGPTYPHQSLDHIGSEFCLITIWQFWNV